MKPHMRQMTRRGDVQPWRDKGAAVMTTTADPIAAMLGRPCHHDPIPSLKIGQRGKQGRIAHLIKRLWPDQIAKGPRHMNDSIRRNQIHQSTAHRRLVKIIHCRPQRGDQCLMICMLITHFLSSNIPGSTRGSAPRLKLLTLPLHHKARSCRHSVAHAHCIAPHDQQSPRAYTTAIHIPRPKLRPHPL